jgi:hypothetical protein
MQADKYLRLLKENKLTGKATIVRALGLKWFRLNTLYYIKDKSGAKVRFVPNAAQRRLYIRGHNRDLILKARQLGFTTFKMLDSLDSALFIVNFSAGCIAQDLSTAKDIYRNKIVFAYEQMSKVWLSIFKSVGLDFPVPKTDTDMSYVFSNGSSIQVSTSYRGGTLQDLHISEFGKICCKTPDKAKEIVTGAFEAVGGEGSITIESTAEGREGYFYEYSDKAEKAQQQGQELTRLDFKFHFYPWYEDPSYSLGGDVVIPDYLDDYFDGLASKGIELSLEQKNWYVKKAAVLFDDMAREYPSTPDEAFQQSTEGAYYKKQMTVLRKGGRITTNISYNPSYPVFTAWDLGMSDEMCIWFAQVIGRDIHVIDYLEDSGEGFEYYAQLLDQKKYHYSWHFAPHDISVRELGTGISRQKSAAQFGIRFERVPRISNQMEGVNAVRMFLPNCHFSEKHCHRGIDCLDNYKKEWDERMGCYKDRPRHDWASHGAKAFETLARAPIYERINEDMPVIKSKSNGWKGYM